MSRRTSAQRVEQSANIVGAEPSGLSEEVASNLEARVEAAFRKSGERVHLRGMRLIPSTKVELGDGVFQVMANTVVNIIGREGAPERLQAFDSVVTVKGANSAGQVLKGVIIPALEPVKG